MNELLLEFFNAITEKRISVSVADQPPGTVQKTAGGRFRAKQIRTNKVLYWGDEEMATAWARGQKDDTGGDTQDAPSGKDKPASTLTPKDEPPTGYQPPEGEKQAPTGQPSAKTKPIVKSKDLDQSVDSVGLFNKDARFAKDGVSDREFSSNEDVESATHTITPRQLAAFFIDQNGNTLFPKKYIKVLSRLLSTQPSTLTISDFTNASGAGTLASTTGELLTMMGASIQDDQTAEKFFSTIEQLVKANQKLKESIIDTGWVKSAKKVRSALVRRYDSQFGQGNWQLSGFAWDVKDEVEALGLPDYKNNKGFSTDIYIRVSSGGQQLLDEISLKKELKANLLNGTSGRVSDIMVYGAATDEDRKLYEDLNAKLDALAGNTSAKAKRERNELNKQRNEIIEKYNLQVPDEVRVDRVQMKQALFYDKYVSDERARAEVGQFAYFWKQLSKKQKLEIAQQISTSMNQKETYAAETVNKFDQLFKLGISTPESFEDSIRKTVGTDPTRRSKILLSIMNGIQASGQPSKLAKVYNTAIIQNSHTHSKAVRDFLLQNQAARKGLLLSIRDAFPLKSLFEGEETMVLGEVVADTKVLHHIFETDNFEELEQKLTVRDEPPPPSIVYRAVGQEDIPIAEITSRPDGIGYGKAWKLEMSVHKDFAKKLQEANKVVYNM